MVRHQSLLTVIGIVAVAGLVGWAAISQSPQTHESVFDEPVVDALSSRASRPQVENGFDT